MLNTGVRGKHDSQGDGARRDDVEVPNISDQAVLPHLVLNQTLPPPQHCFFYQLCLMDLGESAPWWGKK